ncbi:MAG: hypothetical protein DI539_01160 [Flavobacterium psychrophilum]|nr:MAG: hypothetical protein DI539_01160 [Flavobacterium psychrophilum]
MKRFFLPLVLLVFVSCTITYKRNVKVEFNRQDETTLTEFLNLNNVTYDPNDMLALRDINYFAFYNEKHGLEVPHAFFFNGDGISVVNDFNGTNCGHVIKNLDKIENAKSDGAGTVDDFLLPSTYLFGKPADETNGGKKYDAYIVITWGLFAESISKGINKTSFKWYADLKKNNPEVRVFLLNLDIQKTWELSPEQQASLGMQKV